MKNVTISLDNGLLDASRAYAAAHETSLNQLVRDLLEKTVRQDPEFELEKLFEWIDKRQFRSEGGPLSREEAHAR